MVQDGHLWYVAFIVVSFSLLSLNILNLGFVLLMQWSDHFFFSQPLTPFTAERKERESIIFHSKNILALLLLEVRDL